jgi:hypothetical protein
MKNWKTKTKTKRGSVGVFPKSREKERCGTSSSIVFMNVWYAHGFSCFGSLKLLRSDLQCTVTFCTSWFFDILENLSGWGKTAPSGASQFLKIRKDLLRRMSLIHKWINLEPCFLYLACTPQEAIFLCINHPRARARKLEPWLQSPSELFKLASPNLFTLPQLTFPAEALGKNVSRISLLFLSPVSWPPWHLFHATLAGMLCGVFPKDLCELQTFF